MSVELPNYEPASAERRLFMLIEQALEAHR